MHQEVYFLFCSTDSCLPQASFICHNLVCYMQCIYHIRSYGLYQRTCFYFLVLKPPDPWIIVSLCLSFILSLYRFALRFLIFWKPI